MLKVQKSTNEINIILLGESGVGKSTFINALQNYFYHQTFEKAKNGQLKILLPAFFTITDENYNQIRVKIGNEDRNEQDATGKAATQSAKTHTIKMGSYLINIIDTPGIGDPEGFKKDKENFEETIQYISSYQKLNGICILLKPNNARLDLHFRYCFKELLVHLHRKAAPNIVFCFTNTRGTFYRPGDSLPPLKKLVKDIENDSKIKIPIDSENIFCFDNESFRFLAAMKQGVLFSSTDTEDFSKSWEKSFESAKTMIEYIAKLPFHDIVDTVELNEAKQILNELSKPIAEISQNIQINIKLAEDKKNELEELDNSSLNSMSLDDLEDALYVEQIDFERVELSKPRTVCTKPECTRLIKVGSTTKIDYFKHCHAECYLKGVQVECIGHPEMKNCTAMNGTEECKLCGHHYTVHQHVMYENKEVSVQAMDENVKSLIEQKTSKREILEESIKSISKHVKQLEKEQSEIISISAKFAAFTKQHSIIVFNDDLDSYLDLLIREEVGKSQLGADNSEVLAGLRDVKENYTEQKKIFRSALANSNNISAEVSEIDSMIDDMCRLTVSGDKIQKIVQEIRFKNRNKKKNP